MQRVRVIGFVLAAAALAAYSQKPAPPMPAAGPPPAPGIQNQPVLILMNTRFYDHTHPQFAVERIHLLLPVLRQLRQQYPKSGISSVFQFSGSVSEVLSGINEQMPVVQEVKDAVASGLIEAGYTGEDEPTYGNRPEANFLLADTPEQRWLQRAAAGRRFLTEYKDPILGDAVPGLSGGLKRMQEVFGESSYVTGWTQNLGDNSPLVHELRNQNRTAVLAGLPNGDQRRGIVEYRVAASNFGKILSPVAGSSPEVYWEDNILHSSDVGGADTRLFSADEGPEALKAAFAKMDRSVVRVIHMEFGSYLRYLRKGPDGKPMYPPLDWAYQHPQAPGMPVSLSPFAQRRDLDAETKKEEATMRWLLEQFLPANPGSRFVSTADLRKMAHNPVGSDLSREQLKLAVADLISRYSESPTVPNFARGRDDYYSLTDMFGMLTTALAEFDHTGALPASVKLTNIYGPLEMTSSTGPYSGEFSVASIARTAAGLRGALHDETWKPLPNNVTPTWVTVDGVRLNSAQFLRLMAQAYLDPVRDKRLSVKPCMFVSMLGQVYPRHLSIEDQGNTWTFKPAILRAGGAALAN